MRMTLFALIAAAEFTAAIQSARAGPGPASPAVAVAPQYDTTHVYVAPEDVDRFVASFTATFGGESTKQVVATVTPTPSSTTSQLIQTPVGTVSLFGFKTPIPYPFGSERTGYLVSDIEKAVVAAKAAGADVIVTTFPDPIGRDAVIQWPGGLNMQLYWHRAKPDYAAFETVPENRFYVSADRVKALVDGFLRFSQGKVASDQARAPGEEIGLPGTIHRRLRIESAFGKMTLFVTDGHLPYPFGREVTGYEVRDLDDTLRKAKTAGVTLLADPRQIDDRRTAMVMFPGGYVAEIHQAAGRAD